MVAFDLREDLEALQDVPNYTIDNEHDIRAMEMGEVDSLLQKAVASVAAECESITDPEILDIYRSILKFSDAIPGVLMTKLLDSLSTGLASEVESTNRDMDQLDQQELAQRKTAIEIYTFLINWFVIAAENFKGADEDAPIVAPTKSRRGRGGKAANARAAAKAGKPAEWTWASQVPATLTLLCKVLKLRTNKLWPTNVDRDTFIECLTRPVYRVFEKDVYMKVDTVRKTAYTVICLAVKHHGHGTSAQTSIMQALQYYEHLAEHMADCLTALARDYDHYQLGDEILREIAGKTFNAQDNTGPRAFSRFLVRFGEASPRSVLKQLSLLLGHLDSESYPMRIAIVEILGSLIQELALSPDLNNDAQQTQKQLNGLYDHLLDRVLDLSSYVRTKVSVILAKLCDLPVKFPKQRLAITRAAVNALEDKTANVRKAAISLLIRLILTHPYGLMHGGLLGQAEWEKRYEQVAKELQVVEEKVEKAIEITQNAEAGDEEDADDDDDEEEDENEEGGEEEGEGSQSPRKRKRRQNDDDSMDVDEEDDDADSIMDEDEPEEGTSKSKKPRKGKKKTKAKKRKSELDLTAIASQQEALAALESNEVLHLKLRKRYYSEALNFIRQIGDAMEVLGKLLGSKHKAEVLESMEFFRVAHEYAFDTSEIGIKRMIHLIWHKDNNAATSEDGKELKGIRQRVLECYKSLYFEPLPDMEPKQQVNRITKNMIELTYNATLAELTSLEEMMRYMMDDNQIHSDIINRLWQVYSSERPLPKQQRRGAIIILGMLALARRSVMTDKVDVLLKVGMGPLGKSDLILTKYTCLALQRLNGSAKKVKGSLLDNSVRVGMDSPIFRKLHEVIEHRCRSRDWFGMTEQAINTVYALGEHPEEFSETLIKKLTKRAFTRRARLPTEPASTHAPNPDAMDEDAPPHPDAMQTDEDAPASTPLMRTSTQPGPSSQGSVIPSGDAGDAFAMSQLLFVVGHVAIKQIVHLELIEREWKRQKQDKELVDKVGASGDDAASKDGEDIDQVAGNAEDEIGERIAAVRETELLYGPDSLLAIYGPLLVNVCGSPHVFKNSTLRAAATLAFSKFLCVSSRFCDENHMLLFKILETSKDPNIRSNIVIALGDVAVSFSTIVDENSSELYRGLSDTNLIVKKNTLMVLTHLILNGMIKVKGQLGEMAKCLEDEEPRIADLAKLFFTDLATKDNAIYNNLPDVISHLSVGEHAIDEETFQNTMKYIFGFIVKEKQAENIVEKLCQRFRLSEDPRQWRDIAYCLSLLPFKSERSMKKLIEGLQFYRDKLHEETVYARFQEILTKARSTKSTAKPDSEINEFEKILEESRRQGEEDQAFEKQVEGKKAQAKKRATRRTARKKAPVVEDVEASE
ncbi:non-SMC mitotic condensation complex subunit 1-domain-containing protein [Amylostereum chailletii]|nr:non-SMC mitotic condensation complex subunit 1-domain-containing protein [Amylostereum chailletii]